MDEMWQARVRMEIEAINRQIAALVGDDEETAFVQFPWLRDKVAALRQRRDAMRRGR